MYRNCYYKRPCYCNSNTKYETMCSNVNNTMDTGDECDCGFDDDDNLFPKNPVFGQSYVPWQTMNKTFIPEVGLKKGTIFPELVDPYVPCQSMEENAYIRANDLGEGLKNQCQMN